MGYMCVQVAALHDAISVIARLKSLSAYALSWQLHLLYISIITE